MRDKDKALMELMGAPCFKPAGYHEGKLWFAGVVTFLEDCGDARKGDSGYYDDDDWSPFEEECLEGECEHGEDGEDDDCPGREYAVVYLGMPFASDVVYAEHEVLRPATREECERWVADELNDMAVEKVRQDLKQEKRELGDDNGG